jgi:hypothetical protein
MTPAAETFEAGKHLCRLRVYHKRHEFIRHSVGRQCRTYPWSARWSLRNLGSCRSCPKGAAPRRPRAIRRGQISGSRNQDDGRIPDTTERRLRGQPV